jgi:hypothetical protein
LAPNRPANQFTPIQKHQQAIAQLEEDNHKLKRELNEFANRSEGSLFDLSRDTAKDIAAIIVGKLTASKASSIAKEITNALKNKKTPGG